MSEREDVVSAMTEPNADLAYAVLDQIDAHPESWWQELWWAGPDCGTGGCFAGWTLALSGEKPVRDPSGLVLAANGMEVPDRAAVLLGFDTQVDMDNITEAAGEDYWLFCADNAREDLGRMVAEIFGPRPGERRQAAA